MCWWGGAILQWAGRPGQGLLRLALLQLIADSSHYNNATTSQATSGHSGAKRDLCLVGFQRLADGMHHWPAVVRGRQASRRLLLNIVIYYLKSLAPISGLTRLLASQTRSSAVAKRPLGASCLLYSFNTKRRAHAVFYYYLFRLQI